ncbi:MAG: OmpA family protein [Demequinaceae bacterium]|nr:OmpA family protein [Demequinaceae bacterium]
MGAVGYLTYVFDTTDDPTFAFDSADLTASDKAALSEIALAITDSLTYDPEILIHVAGHTDSSGPAAYNQTLSENRARAVRDYLVAQGVPAGALGVVGNGEARPIAANDTEAGRAANRRVELTMVED